MRVCIVKFVKCDVLNRFTNFLGEFIRFSIHDVIERSLNLFCMNYNRLFLLLYKLQKTTTLSLMNKSPPFSTEIRQTCSLS